MGKQLKCVLTLSLQEIALRKVAVLLWSDSDVLAFVAKFPLCEMYNTEYRPKIWQTFEDKVKDKVFKLELPKSLQELMVNIVEPIGVEIRRWKMSSQICVEDARKEDCLPDLPNIYFTAAGAVDYKKSAEELVRWKKLNVIKRYEIACLYCLEDCIPILWKELPAEMKYIYSNNDSFQQDLLFCWPRILKGNISKLDSLLGLSSRNLTFNQWAFERSAKIGNKTAAEYFFLKLTDEEREASLTRTALSVLECPITHYKSEKRHSHLLCNLLCLMTPEQQMETIKAHPVRVLLSFFDWPLQDLFVENSSLIWPYVPSSGYNELLRKLADKCKNLCLCFPKVFKEFYVQSPLDFKKHFVGGKSGFGGTPACLLLHTFFDAEDSDSIEAIFRSLDAADRLKIMCRDDFLFLVYTAIEKQKWNMIELCLREAHLSKEDRMELKRKFLNGHFFRLKPWENKNDKRRRWENETFTRFMEFLDETDASTEIEKKGQKRKLENCSSE